MLRNALRAAALLLSVVSIGPWVAGSAAAPMQPVSPIAVLNTWFEYFPSSSDCLPGATCEGVQILAEIQNQGTGWFRLADMPNVRCDEPGCAVARARVIVAGSAAADQSCCAALKTDLGPGETTVLYGSVVAKGLQSATRVEVAEFNPKSILENQAQFSTGYAIRYLDEVDLEPIGPKSRGLLRGEVVNTGPDSFGEAEGQLGAGSVWSATVFRDKDGKLVGHNLHLSQNALVRGHVPISGTIPVEIPLANAAAKAAEVASYKVYWAVPRLLPNQFAIHWQIGAVERTVVESAPRPLKEVSARVTIRNASSVPAGPEVTFVVRDAAGRWWDLAAAEEEECNNYDGFVTLLRGGASVTCTLPGLTWDPRQHDAADITVFVGSAQTARVAPPIPTSTITPTPSPSPTITATFTATSTATPSATPTQTAEPPATPSQTPVPVLQVYMPVAVRGPLSVSLASRPTVPGDQRP